MSFQEKLYLILISCFLAGSGKILYDYRKPIWIFLKKQRLKLFPVTFNVALSIEFGEGLNSGTYYQGITSNLKKALEQQGLSNVIKLKDFSDIYKFNTTEDAEKYRNQKELDLLIWGNFSTDNLKEEGKNVNFLNLKFTFGHPKDPKNKIGHMLLMDISSSLATKNYWKIVEDSSSKDVEIISNNLFDVSIYIIAVSLKMFGRIGVSIKLLESLYEKLTIRNDPLKERLIPHLINCYELIIEDAIFDKKIYSMGKDCCGKILKLRENDAFGLTNLALFQYQMGEKEEAKDTVDKLLSLYPRDHATEVDVAFFKILDQDYKGAFKHYQRLVDSKGPLNFNIIHLIEFLDEVFDNIKEPAILYAKGILNYFYADKIRGKQDLRKFLRKGNNGHYKEMYRATKKILKN